MAPVAARPERVRAIAIVSALLTTLVGGCAVVSCSSSSSSSTPPVDAGNDVADAGATVSDDAATCALPGPFGSTKCNECVLANCCPELSACGADPSCKTVSTCITGCIDEPDAGGCVGECFAATPGDAGLYKALEKCTFFSKPCDFECSTRPNQ